jgi:hypothetical protein
MHFHSLSKDKKIIVLSLHFERNGMSLNTNLHRTYEVLTLNTNIASLWHQSLSKTAILQNHSILLPRLAILLQFRKKKDPVLFF